MSEATAKASKKLEQKVTSLTEEVISGGDTDDISTSEDLIDNEPIENYNVDTDFDTLYKMYQKAKDSAMNAVKDDQDIVVFDIEEYGYSSDTVSYFNIYDNLDPTNSYTVYQIGADIYYRHADEFNQIIQDFKDEVPGQTIESLKVEYADKDEYITSYPITDIDDCMFIISSIFSSITGQSYDNDTVYESCKIKQSTKLDSDNDLDQSKEANDAKYGTEEVNDFKQEIEDKQKQDGTIGALDPLEENVVFKTKIPNVNLISESSNKIIEYEVNDPVIYNGEKWIVFAVSDAKNDIQNLKITREGHTIDVTSNKVKPDPSMLSNTDYITNQFEFNKDNLNVAPKNDKVEKMKDLNGKTVECNIVVDSTVFTNTLNGNKFKANLKDVLEGLEDIRVYVDDDEQTWHKDNIDIPMENWINAVIASETDEPIRKIKVNPKSYVDAKDDTDLILCTVGGKLTELPKHAIRILV